MTRQSSIRGGGFGVWPILRPQDLGAAAFSGQDTGNRMPGFAGDGDYIDLPTGTGNVEYFNAAGASQWTWAETDLHANVDSWVGFTFDSGLIYTVGVDAGPTPYRFYLASCTSAGPPGGQVDIGDDDLTGGQFTYEASWYGTLNGSNGASSIQRVGNGSGDIIVVNRADAAAEVMTLAIADGSESVAVAAISATGMSYAPYLTADSIYVEVITTGIYLYHADLGPITLGFDPIITDVIGYNSQQSAKFLGWGDYVIAASNGAAAFGGPRIFLRTTFDAWVKRVYEEVCGRSI